MNFIYNLALFEINSYLFISDHVLTMSSDVYSKYSRNNKRLYVEPSPPISMDFNQIPF